MSADPTRPLPTGWQRPNDTPGHRPSGTPSFTPHETPGYQQRPADAPNYQRPPSDTQSYQQRPYDAPGYQQRRGRRFPVKTTVAIVVLLLLLVGADRVAAAVTENAMASQFQTQMSLSGKPSVSIQGFPFLTQLASRDFNTVVISGHNLTDQQLDLASINVVAHGMHIHGTNSATIDSLTGSVTVTLASLANVGGVPANITLRPAGPNLVKATISVPVLGNETVTSRVTQEGTDQIHVQVVDAGGIPSNLLGSLANFTVTIPKLPEGVAIKSVAVTSAGVQVSFTGSHTTLSQ